MIDREMERDFGFLTNPKSEFCCRVNCGNVDCPNHLKYKSYRSYGNENRHDVESKILADGWINIHIPGFNGPHVGTFCSHFCANHSERGVLLIQLERDKMKLCPRIFRRFGSL